MGFRVQDLGFRVSGMGFVSVLGPLGSVSGFGFMVISAGRFRGLGFWGFRVFRGSRFRIWHLLVVGAEQSKLALIDETVQAGCG